MPTISSAGLGSGIDVNGIVDKLVTAEGEPVSKRLDRKEANLQLGLSALGTFKSALADFQSSLGKLTTPGAFNAVSSYSADEEIFSASAQNDAIEGEYAIRVLQLAEAQKLISPSFDSDFDQVGQGTLSIEFGNYNVNDNTFTSNPKTTVQRITIDEQNSSLRGIQQTINSANIGVRASIINDGSGYRLVFSSMRTGLDNSLRILVNDQDGNDTDLTGLSTLAYNPTATTVPGANLSENAAAQDALLSIDGIQVSHASNQVEDVIPGIALTLKQTSSEPVDLQVVKDTEGVKQAISEFVENYNALITTVSALTGYNPETGEAGPLSGDSSVRGIVEQLRRRMGTAFNGVNEQFTTLASLGIDTNRDGILTLNQDRLQQALQTREQEVMHLFAAVASTTDPQIRVTSEIVPSLNGRFEININQAAQRGVYSGLMFAAQPIQVTDSNDNFTVMVDGVVSNNLGLNKRNYATGEELAQEIQRVINNDAKLIASGVKVDVEFVNNHFEISSQRYGSASQVGIRSADPGLPTSMGLVIADGLAGKDIDASVDGFDVVASGRKLTLQGDADGVVLEVQGDKTGKRGELVITNGVASLLNDMTSNVLASKGLLDTRFDGFNNRLKDITEQRDQLARRLENSEARYLKQFTNLDAMLGRMRSTSNFLAQRLGALPGAGPTTGSSN